MILKRFANLRQYAAASVLVLILSASCKKIDDWLDVKRSLTDVRPSTLKDFQAIFDNLPEVNESLPIFGLIGSDNLFIPDSKYLSITAVTQQNAYKWAPDLFESNLPSSWTDPYSIAAYANLAIEGINQLNSSTSSKEDIDNVLGQAYFHRGLAFYNIAQLFCKPYNAATAATDLGIPIRLSSDVNIPSVRSSVEETYNQIITDTKKSIALLKATQLYKSRPTKTAARFLLAKVYLAMEDYEKAKISASEALAEYNTLLDFNTLIINANNPFPAVLSNPEIIFYGLGQGGNTMSPIRALNNVDSVLYSQYAANDLRKGIFFKAEAKYFVFKGSYDQTNTKCFAGFATNELYLIRAECNARSGSTTDALADLNAVMSKRYNKASFVPFTAANADAALSIVLNEKRKELVYTGQVRWEDLRRLNKDVRFAVTIKRVLNGTTYILPPNDKKYVFPIPDIEVQQYGLQQNPR